MKISLAKVIKIVEKINDLRQNGFSLFGGRIKYKEYKDVDGNKAPGAEFTKKF